MKKTTTIGLAVVLAVALASCAPQSSVKSGAAMAESLIRLLPKPTGGVIAIDVQRITGTEAAVKALQDPQAKQKYDEFVTMSGIDPMKDINFVVIGLDGAPPAIEEKGSVIVNLKYDKDKLLGLLKEKAPELETEIYNGVTIYSGFEAEEKKRTSRGAFLDGSHIVIGSEAGIKGIIDVHQKKAESIVKNVEMSAILKKVDKAGIAWGAFVIPPDLIKKGIDASPQLKVLEGVTAMTMAFDYKLATFTADIRTLGGTKEQNANLASALNGFKALGGMMAAQEPAVGDVLNGLEITSGPDFTRLHLSLSQEVMDKLGKLAQSKAGDFMKIKKDEPQEEKK